VLPRRASEQGVGTGAQMSVPVAVAFSELPDNTLVADPASGRYMSSPADEQAAPQGTEMFG
jgi:hypothetical protein